MPEVRSIVAGRISVFEEKSQNTNGANQSTLALRESGCIAVFSPFSHSLWEVEVCGCVDC